MSKRPALHDMPADASPELLHLADVVVAKVKLSEIIGRHVSLKRLGREWHGNSPFAPDVDGSLFVNDDGGYFFCFASKRCGDAIRFVMETEGCSYNEAVALLNNIVSEVQQ